jgi:transcription elongation factor Elf1
MKILKCPQCNELIVVDLDEENLQQTIRCSKCGFVDYAYAFNLRHNTDFYSRNFYNITISGAIDILKQQLESNDLNKVDITKLIYDLHQRLHAFSPLVLCELINMLIDNNNHLPEEGPCNDSMFVVFEPERVSLDDIFQKIHQDVASLLRSFAKVVIQNDYDYDGEIRRLKSNLHSTQKEEEAWEQKYSELAEKNEALEKEITTLKNLLHRDQ